MMKETRLADLDLSVFAPLVNTAFQVIQETGEPVQLVLAEAKPLSTGEAGAHPNGGSFSLVFRGPDRSFLPQKMRIFEHEKLGRFSVFLVPIGKGNGVFEYQVVFNRSG